MKVKALDTYKKLNIKDKELNRVVEKGEVFEVTNERYLVLTGKNRYKEVFVEEVVEESAEEAEKVEEKSKKRKIKQSKIK